MATEIKDLINKTKILENIEVKEPKTETEETGIMKQESYINIDQNIAFNIMELIQPDNKQAEIITKSLLFYFCDSFQNDLFGYKTLDPKDFADKMKISYTKLFDKNKNSKFTKEITNWIEKTPDEITLLENVLLSLTTKPLIQHYKTSNKDFDIFKIKSFILIKDLEIHKRKPKRGIKPKIFYKYQLNEAFEENLKRLYFRATREDYNLAKQKNVENLYLTIINIYNNYRGNGYNCHYFKWEDICNFLSISSKLTNPRKKERINTKLNYIKSILENKIEGFNYSWEKGAGCRYAYSLKIYWDKLDKKAIEKEIDKNITFTILFNLKRKLFKEFSLRNNEINEKTFLEWLTNIKNYKDIRPLFTQTLYESVNLKKTNQKQKEYNEKFLDNLYKRMTKVKDTKELSLFFNKIE